MKYNKIIKQNHCVEDKKDASMAFAEELFFFFKENISKMLMAVLKDVY